MMLTKLRSFNPEGETFCQLAPPSRVICTRPLVVPAQITFAESGEGESVLIAPLRGPGRREFWPDAVFSAGRAAKSGLISCQLAAPSVVSKTYCVPK